MMLVPCSGIIPAVASFETPRPDARLQADLLRSFTEYKRSYQLPEWARQGRSRQVRLDGGPMFTACQLESKWDYLFNPKTPGFVGIINAVWTLTNLYANDLEEKLDRIRSAGYNWVWVSYQLGYAFEDEARQREQVHRLIKLAHARDIRITAYFSLTSIFTRSAFVKDPESKNWVQENADGSPGTYQGIPERQMACVNKPGRLDYLKKIVRLAVEHDADDIFYDSIFNRCYCSWCRKGFRDYSRLVLGRKYEVPAVSNTQQKFGIDEPALTGGGAENPAWGLFLEYGHYAVARALAELDKYAKSLNPKVTLSANSHQFRFIDWVTDITWSEDASLKGARIDEQGRLTTPMGVYAWCQATAGGKKSAQVMVTPHEYWELQPPEYYEITISEATSFQCNFTMLAGYAFATRYEDGDPAAQRAWEGIARGMRFIAAHQELFEDVSPAADIGIYNSGPTRILMSILKQSGDGQALVQLIFRAGYPVRILNDEAALETGAERLARDYQLIVLAGSAALSEEEIRLLNRYVALGGKLIATRDTGQFTSFLTPRKQAPWNESSAGVRLVTKQELETSPDRIAVLLCGVLSRPPFATFNGSGYQVAIPNRKGDRLIVHLLNYDTSHPQKDLRVVLAGKGNTHMQDILRPGCAAHWISLDEPAARPLNVEWVSEQAAIQIPELRISGLLVLSSGPSKP
ncbi:MAG: alpha-amylase family protein [Candidatus Solibacter sp.]